MSEFADKTIDMHVHVGLVGDEYPQWGGFSRTMMDRFAYKLFLLYARIERDLVCDRVLREAAKRIICTSGIDHVVCLALDPVYDKDGTRRTDLSHMWVDNEYILDLRQELGDKRVLLGASVHPYCANFKERVHRYVEKGAVLLKWLPSAQHINLADEQVGEAMQYLAKVGPDGGPLPLLLHVGVEYAIPAADERAASFDFLSWSRWDRLWNLFRGRRRWYVPNLLGIRQNIAAALEAGAVIIFAHCGLPFFATRPFARWLEHSDLEVVREYLERYRRAEGRGHCFADVSAFCTPFRRDYFEKICELPRELLLFGSDYPVPIFELSAGPREWWEDFKAVMRGELDRIIVPQDNLLDVNRRELMHAFPGHPLFTNFGKLLDDLGLGVSLGADTRNDQRP